MKGVSDKEAVRIFLEYERAEDAAKAYADMNGRYFGGRVVKARFYDERRYANGDLERRISRIILLTNLVGAGEVDESLEEETAEEASKYGKVRKCVIKEINGAPDDEAVRIFVEYERSEDAAKALADMNGRLFGGRKVKARFYEEERYAKGDLEKNTGEAGEAPQEKCKHREKKLKFL